MDNVTPINDPSKPDLSKVLPATPIQYSGQRVVTLKMIDEVHGRTSDRASKNLRELRNNGRAVEGVHFFELRQASEIRNLGLGRENGGVPDKVYLVTERGYFLLIKMFHDDLAWDIYEQVLDVYFRAKQAAAVPVSPVGPIQLTETDFKLLAGAFSEMLDHRLEPIIDTMQSWQPDRKPTKDTQQRIRFAISQCTQSFCPMCMKNRVVDERAQRIGGTEWLRWFGRHLAAVDQVVLSCSACARLLKRSRGAKEAAQLDFDDFHSRRRRYERALGLQQQDLFISGRA